MVVPYFLIQQVASLILAAAYPWLAAKKDAMQIIANGSLDSLKTDWHKVNVWIRVAVFGCLSVAANTGNPEVAPFFFFLAAAVHWLVFDYRLNTLRGLDAWYQGQNAKADAFASKRLKWLAFGLTLVAYLASCYWVLLYKPV